MESVQTGANVRESEKKIRGRAEDGDVVEVRNDAEGGEIMTEFL